MGRKEEELKVIVSAAEKANGPDVKTEPVETLYPETKWGPDKDHPIKFEDIEDPEERRFFEGKEHLEDVYPGVTKGMLVNFSVNGALFDPVSQTPADMKNNYEAMAAAMSKKGFSYDKMAQTLSEYGIDDNQATILTERAYLNSEAFRMRACRSLGYESVEQMPVDVRNTYDHIIERAQDSNEYLKIIQDDWGMSSFYGNSEQLVTKAKDVIESGEIDEDEAVVLNDDINDVRGLYVDGKMDPKDGISYVNDNEAKDVGVNVTAHEISHYVYNKDQVNPGVHENGNEYKGESVQFGKKGSPLDKIDKNRVKYDLAYLINYFGGNTEVARMVYKPTNIDERMIAKSSRDHDNVGFERAADIHGVRMLMFKEGIYNPFDGSDVTPEQVGKFMEEYPNSRIFRYWDKKDNIFFLNNIASNDSLQKVAGENLMAALKEKDDGQKTPDGHISASQINDPALTAANFYQDKYENYVGNERQESKGLSV